MSNFAERFATRVRPLKASGTALARQASSNAGGRKFDLASGQLALAIDAESQQVIDAAIAKVAYSYGPAGGFARLRDALAQRAEGFLDGQALDGTNVLVAPGAKNALFGLCIALVDAGDEVLIASPYWTTFAEQVRLCGGTPTALERVGDESWTQALRRTAGPRARVLIVNTPCNPTGEVIEAALLADMVDFCAQAGIHVVLDLSYRELVFADRDRLTLPADLVHAGHVSIVESFSKNARLPGWRIGHVLGNATLVAKLEALATHMNSGASVLCQAGVLGLLETGAINRLVASSRGHVEANLALTRHLDEATRAVLPPPRGGFFSLLRLPAGTDCVQAQKALLQRHDVMTTAGQHFNAPGMLRVSFGAARDDVAAGLAGLERFLQELRADEGVAVHG